jgi:hypothetical protein
VHEYYGYSKQSDMLDADIHVTYTGPQNRTGATLTPTDGFVDLHLGATWRPTGLLPGLTLSAFADNRIAVYRNGTPYGEEYLPSGPKSAMTLPPDASGCAGSRPSEPWRTNRFGDIFAVTVIWIFSHGVS